MAQIQVEKESSARCTEINGKYSDTILKLPNGILASCYILNGSSFKRLLVGFEATSESKTVKNSELKYAIVLKFINASAKANGIQREMTINKSVWMKLQDNFDLITAYFTNDYEYYKTYGGQRALKLDNFEIFFTNSYGAKALVLEQRPQSMDDVDKFKQVIPIGQDNKKMKLYLPSIVMQRITFEGLKAVSKCINTQIARLERNEESINACTTFLKEHTKRIIQERFPHKVNQEELLNDIWNFSFFVKHETVSTELREKVKENLSKDFNEKYFDIVIEEIFAFDLFNIMDKIRVEMLENVS